MTRREYVWTHDVAGEQNGVIGHGFFDLWIDERLDQSEQLGLEIAADNPKASLLADDVELVHNGRRFYITEIEDGRQGTAVTIRVEADALWYRLGEIVHVGSLVITSMTPNEGLQLILRGTGWTAGPATTASADEFSLEQQDKSALALLRTWAKVTARSLVFNTAEHSVDLVDSRGADLGLAFRYGRNVLGARRRRRPPELTVLYPFGADDLTIAGVNGGAAFVEDFTYYTGRGLDLATARELYTRSRVWSDSSFVRDVDLLPAAEARLALQSQPSTSYELDVVDLAEMTAVNENARVADRVNVYDPSFDTDVRTFVTRTRRHPLTPWKNRIELSTILNPLGDPGSSTARSSHSAEWHQFVGPVLAAYQIRSDGDYYVGRLALAFREGGRANYHLDLFATGVDAGVMNVSVIDIENGSEVQRRQVDVPYTNGALVRASLDWAREELLGAYDYRVLVTTTASGGPSAAKGVNIAADENDESSFYVMAQGAIQETPVAESSQRFDYVSDAVQSFTVPAGVTSMHVELVAGGGGGGGVGSGGGARVAFRYDCVPGTVYDVYAPAGGGGGGDIGWPGGGAPGGGPFGTAGRGGGYAAVIPAGAGIASAIAVAGGGGGGGHFSPGGGGGFYNGQNGEIFGDGGGGGATQSAGGTGAAAGGANGGSQGVGGGGSGAGFIYQNGGGGSGIIQVAFFDVELADDYNAGDGFVEFTWEIPV